MPYTVIDIHFKLKHKASKVFKNHKTFIDFGLGFPM